MTGGEEDAVSPEFPMWVAGEALSPTVLSPIAVRSEDGAQALLTHFADRLRHHSMEVRCYIPLRVVRAVPVGLSTEDLVKGVEEKR